MAKEVFDIKVDENNDLLIKNGDFVIAESTLQHQNHLLIAEPGHFRQKPLLGVAISDFLLEDSNLEELAHKIQKEFEVDGMEISKIDIPSITEININAGYKE